MDEHTSFFNIFSYDYLSHTCIDGGLIYEGIVIERDLRIPIISFGHQPTRVQVRTVLTLKKGAEYDAVWFILGMKGEVPYLHFINWNDDGKPESTTSLKIPLALLAPHCHW